MWPFKRKTPKEQSSLETRLNRVGVPFSSDIADPLILKYHALRALCGALMDRHSSCQSPHPFAGIATLMSCNC